MHPKAMMKTLTKTAARPTITEREYSTMQRAYEYFNTELFEDSLPHVP
jgi:hypothetical protein